MLEEEVIRQDRDRGGRERDCGSGLRSGSGRITPEDVTRSSQHAKAGR